MTYNTGNPIGSKDARDRSDNSENLDLAVNSLSQTFVDRLGVTRDTLEGIYQKSAYYRAGTFEAGYTLTNNRQTLAYGNVEYSWSGAFPKVVAAGATPATSGGIGSGAWVDRTDGALRGEFAAVDGAKLIGEVGSFADLRAIVPEYAGQRIQLAGWNSGSKFGGGKFVSIAGDAPDDGGLVARVNSTWYWRRLEAELLSPAMFGGYPDGSGDSVVSILNCEAAASAAKLNVNYTGVWNLSRDVIVGSVRNKLTNSKVTYTNVGRIIFSGSTEGSHIKSPSTISPINGVQGININDPSATAAAYHEFFVNQGMNNQGLAYYNGFYYVSYDVGGGNGMVERYAAGGTLDSTYGGVSIPINHAADIAYRVADGLIYVASGGGAEPTYVRKLAANGKSVTASIDFTAYGNSALCAIDNVNDMLILHSTLTGGDGGLPTFTFFSFADLSTPLTQFTLPATLGVPQGMDVFENTIYFYTNNKVTMISYDGEVRGNFSIGVPGESEGIAITADYGNAFIAVGYNTPRRVMTLRGPHGMVSKGLSCLVNMNPQNAADVSRAPFILPFSIRKSSATAGAAWALTTYAAGDHPGFVNMWWPPVINSSAKRIEVKVKHDAVSTIASVFGGFNGAVYALTGGPYQVHFDFSSDTLCIYLRNSSDALVDPATLAGTAIIWGNVMGGMMFRNSTYTTQ